MVNNYPTTSNWPDYHHYSPVVANVGTEYMVPHFTNDGDDIVFVEPIPTDQPSVLGSGAYYWVSPTTTQTASAHALAAAPYANASGPSGNGIIAWAYDNSGVMSTMGLGIVARLFL